MSWRQWLVLLGLFITYLLLGGVAFMLIEAPEEELRLQELKNLKHFIYDKLIACDKNTTSIDLSKREEVWIQIAEQINQPALINHRSVPPKKWTLYNSFFVAVTVASTIGYGHLAPSSTSGRLFCIAFALIGIPLNGILFATLGDYFGAKLVRRSSKRSLRHCSAFFVTLADVLLYFIPGLVIFLAIPAGLFTIVEGWDYIDSFYYAFISLTTIGFGDLVAGQNDIGRWTGLYRTFIIVWILFGLGYLIMVINIITKGLRSKPVVSLEKRMAARIRATRNMLAKDAIALRQLVNQIKVMKIKHVNRQEKIEACRSWSQPSLCYVTNAKLAEKDGTEEIRPELSGYCSDPGYIDRVNTFGETAAASEKKEIIVELAEDPVQLLTRLATVLCNGNEEEDDLSSPESSSTEDSTMGKKEVFFESTVQRIRRSLRLSECESVESSSSPYSPKAASSFGRATGQRLLVRNRRASEAHPGTFDHRGSIKSHHRLVLEVETKKVNPRTFKRSVSESEPRNHSLNLVSMPLPSKNITSGWSQVKGDLPTGQNCTTDNANQPIASVAEFCDILDRVQSSRQNCAALT